jgi:hypothetical protein
LQLGDRAGYRKDCAAMRKHFAASGDPEAVYCIAWTCIQVRDAVDDWTIDMDQVPVVVANSSR